MVFTVSSTCFLIHIIARKGYWFTRLQLSYGKVVVLRTRRNLQNPYIVTVRRLTQSDMYRCVLSIHLRKYIHTPATALYHRNVLFQYVCIGLLRSVKYVHDFCYILHVPFLYTCILSGYKGKVPYKVNTIFRE